MCGINRQNFQIMNLTKCLMCSVDLNLDTISGTTHFKVIFSFLTGIGQHFIGNTHCRSNSLFTQLIHTLHIFLTGSVLCKSSEKI